MNRQQTQKERILEYLQAGHEITPRYALNNFGCFRLAAVIHRLRDEYIIDDRWIYGDNGKKYKAYFMPSKSDQGELF